QHVAAGRRLEGKRGLLDAIAQLQGFEIAASAWERQVLPQRVVNYNPQWLDDLCLAGDVAWARLSLRKPANGNGRSSTPSRATPISIVLRRAFGPPPRPQRLRPPRPRQLAAGPLVARTSLPARRLAHRRTGRTARDATARPLRRRLPRSRGPRELRTAVARHRPRPPPPGSS